jgi:hypothetical protein
MNRTPACTCLLLGTCVTLQPAPENSIILVMAMDGVIFDFLGNIAVGFAATIAVLAVVGLSIPTRSARASRNHPQSR